MRIERPARARCPLDVLFCPVLSAPLQRMLSPLRWKLRKPRPRRIGTENQWARKRFPPISPPSWPVELDQHPPWLTFSSYRPSEWVSCSSMHGTHFQTYKEVLSLPRPQFGTLSLRLRLPLVLLLPYSSTPSSFSSFNLDHLVGSSKRQRIFGLALEILESL